MKRNGKTTEVRFLFALATRDEVGQFQTRHATSNSAEIEQLMDRWQLAQPAIQRLQEIEHGLADRIQVAALPPQFDAQNAEVITSEPIRNAFRSLPIAIALVELDKLVVPQRILLTQHAAQLASRLLERHDFNDLYRFCLMSSKEVAPVEYQRVSDHVHVFRSESDDLRFLGETAREFNLDERDRPTIGGIARFEISAVVGYGGAAINAVKVGSRLVLQNGLHRIFALRQRGITHAPMIVQWARNAEHEFPSYLGVMPRDYWTDHPRPPLVKDFLDRDFYLDATFAPHRRVLTVTIQVAATEEPF